MACLALVPPLTTLTRRMRSARMVRNTGSMMLNQGGRVLLQGVYFVVVARVLGVDGFGAFSGTIALVALLAPFGSLGAVNLMIKHVAMDSRAAPSWFATALAVTSLASITLITLLGLAAPLVAPNSVSVETVLLVASADLLGARLIEVAGGVYQAQEKMFRTAMFPLLLHGARLLLGLAAIALPGEVTLNGWAVSYLAASVIVTGFLLFKTGQDIGAQRPRFREYWTEWRQGVLFSLSLSSQSVYNDIDKAMLARLSTLEATGVYSAAYRVIDMAFTPMRALLAASYAKFFVHGRYGIAGVLPFTRKLAVPGLAYCLFASVALLVSADLVPFILGSSFEGSVSALRALAVLPLLKGCHYLAADSLTGAGHQGARSAVQVGIAALNLALCFALIPRFDYWGAVIASLVCDGALAIFMWGLVLKISRARYSTLRS